MRDNRNLLQLTSEEKQDFLERWAQSRTLPAGEVFERGFGAEGKSYREIE